ncbi:MAG: metallophosphoesterase [Fischerella sp.]|nr:metallophosphoesterase [Fischerella sp.]
MKIHIVSDLHLNFADITLPGGADLLILAGDITEHRYVPQHARFFQEECTKYPKVLYVFGNHEYYHGYLDATPFLIKAHLPSNVQVLDNDSVDIGDWTFIGSTLWTDMNRGDPLTRFHLKGARGLHDFKVVAQHAEPWTRFTPESAEGLHRKSRQYIDVTTNKRKDRKVFVITHHAPTFQSVHESYRHDTPMNGAFASDLSELILNRDNIRYWVHGHMHTASDYMVGDNCRVICHPRGYAGHEESAASYQPFELEI